MLLDFIRPAAADLRSLLDVGGGIGAIQHELAGSLTGPITVVDASPSYLATARSEGLRRGYADRVSYISGDFVDKVDVVPEADLVTMDRVICCYPDVDDLLSAAVDKSRQAVGLVFPREDVHIRVGTWLVNLVLRLMRSDFQAFVHPHETIERTMTRAGFRPVMDAQTLVWRVALFVQTDRQNQDATVAGQ